MIENFFLQVLRIYYASDISRSDSVTRDALVATRQNFFCSCVSKESPGTLEYRDRPLFRMKPVLGYLQPNSVGCLQKQLSNPRHIVFAISP